MTNALDVAASGEVIDLGRDGPAWTLGDRIYKIRKEMGWDQDELARVVGAHRVTVGKWERDAPKSVPSVVHMRKLVAAVRDDLPWVTYEWLTASP
jgi:transcriptional regulator with XRE-family HTH domain